MDVRALASRLRSAAGRLPPGQRVGRAVFCGRGDREVLDGRARFPRPVCEVSLPATHYVVLRDRRGRGPLLASSYWEYAELVFDSQGGFIAGTVSRALASRAEAAA